MKKYINKIFFLIVSFFLVLFLINPELRAGWRFNLNNSPPGDKYHLTSGMRTVVEDIIYHHFYTSEEQLAREIFDWMKNNIEYGESPGPATASLTFENRRGQCAGQARLFIALARDLGINAWYALVDVDCHGRPVKHACAWVRLDGEEYLIDPAYGLFGADHRNWRVVKDSSSRLLLALKK